MLLDNLGILYDKLHIHYNIIMSLVAIYPF